MKFQIKRLFEYQKKNAISRRFRNKRFNLFLALAGKLKGSIRILDVGGEKIYWETFLGNKKGFDITILNLKSPAKKSSKFKFIRCDAKSMKKIADRDFEIAFSNSTLEHLGSIENQRKAAKEIGRVAKGYFVQTPNRYFLIEPHFLFPLFQFFPYRLKVWLLTTFSLGFFDKVDKKRAEKILSEIRLLSLKELRELFPDGKVYKEKFLGLTKSFVIYKMPK